MATSASKDTSEVRVIPAVQPEAPPRLVAKRRTGHEYYVDHHGGEFWIRTNDKGKNFRLVRAPVDRSRRRATGSRCCRTASA